MSKNKQYTPSDSPILCPINNDITQCRCLLNTSHHHTNLIPAHKCLIQDHPCLHKIKLPSLQVASMPTLPHTIASPVPPPHPSTLTHSSNRTNLIPAHKCLIQDHPCLHEIQLPSLQVASMPTLSHTIAPPVHPPPHPSALTHSSNSLGLMITHV